MRPGAAGRMKNALYNFFIHEVTMLCYRNCLQYFPRDHGYWTWA